MRICLACFDNLLLQLCPTLWDPMDYSPPGSSVHGLLQARILEWVAIPFSKGSSWPRNCCLQCLVHWQEFTIYASIEYMLVPYVQIYTSMFTCLYFYLCVSVQFSHSVMCGSLLPHESQHARPPCPSSTPRVYSNSGSLSRWCHPAISSSAVPFSSCPQSLPASGSFPMSQLFAWCGQSIGVSASASVLPMNTQDWSPLGWTDWISLQSKGLSRVFSNTMVQKHQFFGAQLSSQSNSHIHTWPLEKTFVYKLIQLFWLKK